MKRIVKYLIVIIALIVLLSACSKIQAEKGDPEIKKIESIPFLEDQLYAVAYLGYNEMDDLSFYIEKYLR